MYNEKIKMKLLILVTPIDITIDYFRKSDYYPIFVFKYEFL